MNRSIVFIYFNRKLNINKAHMNSKKAIRRNLMIIICLQGKTPYNTWALKSSMCLHVQSSVPHFFLTDSQITLFDFYTTRYIWSKHLYSMYRTAITYTHRSGQWLWKNDGKKFDYVTFEYKGKNWWEQKKQKTKNKILSQNPHK